MKMLARAIAAAALLAGLAFWPLAQPEVSADAAPAAAAQPADRIVDFDREVRPILSDSCFACHGPDERRRRRGLRLDVAEGPFSDRGRYGGPVVVPGNATDSLLYQRITNEDASRRMPRGSAVTPQSPLTDAQIETIALWIDQGAEWKSHWAFVAPERPEVPAVSDADAAAGWSVNPIDAFVLDRLRREDLEPSEPADRTTLIRRLSYDLTGLPPTPQEIDAFLADDADDAPDAYERVVDRLLASPRYGERMAMRWLDLARYADTHGYHIDSHRDMWPWRDWVIDAYTRNLPFDTFTMEQLAGDLLPDATRDQLIATGFNRNHMINFEGGAIPEEYQVEYVVNRLDTTSTVWMGLTMACSRCHDHKFDPIRQRDFYRFFAFFNNVDEVGLDGQRGNAEPFAQVPTPSQDRAHTALGAEIAATEVRLPEDEIAQLLDAWQADALSTVPTESKAGLVGHFELDGHLADTSGHYRHAEASSEFLRYTGGRIGRAASFDGETFLELDADSFDLNGSEPFSIATWVRPASRLASYAPLSKVDADQGYRGYALSFDPSIVLPGTNMGSRLYFRLIHDWPDDVLSIRTRDPLLIAADGIQPHEAWYHVAVVYDGSRRASGLQFYLNGELLGDDAIDVEYDSLTGSTATSAPLRVGTNLHVGEPPAEKGFSGQIDDLRFYDRPLTADEAARLAIDLPIRSIVATDAEERTEPQDAELRDYFLSRHAPETLRTTWADLRDLLDRQAALDAVVTTTMVMHEREERRETFILRRGDYRNQTDPVTPGTPAALPPMPPGAPANRLGLAQWLVDPSHPLTARVAVNRYWQMYFGTGLVKTAENFGTQGERGSGRATPGCSTGWPPSSCAAAGT